VRQAAITAVLDLSQGDARAAARFSRHADIRTLKVYDDNRSSSIFAARALWLRRPWEVSRWNGS
jgi:hypothetical protein